MSAGSVVGRCVAAVVAGVAACAPMPEVGGPVAVSVPVVSVPHTATRTAVVGVVRVVAADGSVGHGLVVVDGHLVEAVDTVQGGMVRTVSAGDGRVLRHVDLPAGTRAGGLARVSEGLWQLPLDGGEAVLRDPETLQEKRRVAFEGVGLGACFTGSAVVHSEGSNRLVLRNPSDLTERSSVRITGHWVAGQRLAELACVHADGRPQVWALVVGSDWVVRVDPVTGAVTAVASLARIRAEGPGVTGVVGGIAAAGEPDLFWVSGPFRHRFLVRLKVTS